MSTPLFPSEWSKIWIRGTFINLDGSPMAGQVSFAANVTGKTMVASAAKKLIGAKGLSVALDGSGYFQLQIPATNDPDITPLNFTYTVSEPTGRTYPITVPWNTPALSAPSDPLNGQQVIDLTDIVPSPGASGGVGQLLRGIGIQSTTVDGNGHLLVTYTDGRTEDAGFIGSGGSGTVPDATTTVKGKQVLLGGTADAPTVPYGKVTGAPAALPPSGGAGGVLSGNYPNPAFAVDMATQAELDAVSSATQSALDGLPFRANNTTTTGAAVGQVVAVAQVDGQGNVTSWSLVTPSGGSYTAEEAQDAAAVMLVAGQHTNLTATYNDAANRLDLAISGVLPDSVIPSGITRDSELSASITAAIDALKAGAPTALDTLDELAAAIGDDQNFAATITTAIGNRLRIDAAQSLTTGQQAQGRANLAATRVRVDGNPVDTFDASTTPPTAADVGAVALSAFDAKGDQLVGASDNTFVRRPVGTDGQVWTADAASPGGVKWAAPSSGSITGIDGSGATPRFTNGAQIASAKAVQFKDGDTRNYIGYDSNVFDGTLISGYNGVVLQNYSPDGVSRRRTVHIYTGNPEGTIYGATGDLCLCEDGTVWKKSTNNGGQTGWQKMVAAEGLSVTGSRGDGSALTSLLTRLTSLGLIANNTTA